VSIAVTATVTVAITLALTLTPRSHGNPGASSGTGSIAASITPPPDSASTPGNTGSSAGGISPAPAVITGSWSQTSGPLTLTITEVQLAGGVLQLHAKAVNASSSAIDLPLFGNCVATDNTGATYQADPNSPWTIEVPPGQFVTGVIDFNGPVAAGAKTLAVSFATIYGTFAPGITVTGVPVPR
jgi:hypothetical protein